MAVSAYVEQLGDKFARATVKQHLSAIRRLFEYLHAGKVLPENPAELVHGPKHSPREGFYIHPRRPGTPRFLGKAAHRVYQGQAGKGHYRLPHVHVHTRVRGYEDESEGLLPDQAPLEYPPQEEKGVSSATSCFTIRPKTALTTVWKWMTGGTAMKGRLASTRAGYAAIPSGRELPSPTTSKTGTSSRSPSTFLGMPALQQRSSMTVVESSSQKRR